MTEESNTDQEATAVDRLRAYLATISPGPVSDTDELERLLAASWDEFTGDDSGMEGYKLLKRIEDVAWTPPTLTFAIERDGGTVMGSTRAELQCWEIDLERKTAIVAKTGHRQLRPMAQRIYIKPLVERAIAAMRSGERDELVWWHDDGTVSLNTTLIFHGGSAVRMTLEERRKRLREAVAGVLVKEGWGRLGKDSFRPPTTG
jgi:hypothetical protein